MMLEECGQAENPVCLTKILLTIIDKQEQKTISAILQIAH
jgi:hypothetical protein